MLETAPRPVDAHQAGVRVRHRHNPSKLGVTTGEVRFRAGRDVATVELDNGEMAYIATDQLELVPDRESRTEAFAAGRAGGPEDLARILLAEKISGNLTDVYYSMETGKADFHPHQFRPVLKFVQSTGRRILIADEVGLGKTISAIYIWKELLARAEARRLLIVCPAVLRQKWQYELLHRFSVEARIVTAAELTRELEITLRDPLHAFVCIASLEGVRARQIADDEAVRNARQRLMQVIQENPAGETALFDLAVVDEAHAARNSGTANHQFVAAVRDASANYVMLTATPLQTDAENLFNLLKLIDPDRFVSSELFEQARRANIPIIQALNALLSTPPDKDAFQLHIEAASREPLFRDDKLLHGYARVEPGWALADRVRMARMIESRSLLADVMVRTRKREAFPNRVFREPWVLQVSLSPQERRLYESASQRIRQLLDDEAPLIREFCLIGRQRQLASCIPAALQAWEHAGYLGELLWEDLGTDLSNADDDETDISFDDLIGKHDFEAGDSKYRKFSAAIRQHLRDNPEEKIVVFAFFRGTLAYLKRRLESDDIRCAMILGGMGTALVDQREVDAKTAEIARFRAPDGPSILLSSEVGSEGIDLQFARVVFNYDLPWNPMRVEQRIGRIDRMGQTAERIVVGHFATEGTIDDRILNRLYERINVFEESIGDLDEILGERIQDILRDYFRGTLTAEETERRLEQNLLFQASTEQAKEELEREASALAGHADFVLNSIKKSHETGRYVRPDDLRRYVTYFLSMYYPGSQIEYDDELKNCFRIILSSKARDALGAHIERRPPARRTRLADPGVTVIARFDPNVPGRPRDRAELIDITHPLLLWIRNQMEDRRTNVIPAFAVEVDAARTTLQEGCYVFATDRWRLEGVRRQVTVQHVVLSLTRGERVPHGQADPLINAAAQFGRPLQVDQIGIDRRRLVATLRACEAALEEDFLRESDEFESENAIRVGQSRQLIEARAERIIARTRAILDEQMNATDPNRRRIAPATHARLRRAEDDRDKQRARLERQGQTLQSRRPVGGGMIVVKGRSNHNEGSA